MKLIAQAALDALENGEAIVAGAVEIAAPVPARFWGGHGQITFDGRTFDPIGDRSLVQVAGGALGGAAQSITLSLSGIEPKVLEGVGNEDIGGAPTTLWRMIWSGDGNTLLDANVWARGRFDHLKREEEIGGTATLSAMIETAAHSLGRRGARLRSDADQRLIKANDGFFKNVSFAGSKTLYWNGRRPSTAGSAVRGRSGGGANEAINTYEY